MLRDIHVRRRRLHGAGRIGVRAAMAMSSTGSAVLVLTDGRLSVLVTDRGHHGSVLGR